MNQQASRSREILACLGDASRFRLVLSLLERERCVTELAERVGLSQSCTTRHLQFLEREGVVRGLRQGKRVVFHLRADRPRVRELLAWLVGAQSEVEGAPLSGADLHIDGPVAEAGGQSPQRPAGRGPGTDRTPEPGRKAAPRELRAKERVSTAAFRGTAEAPSAAVSAAGGEAAGRPDGAGGPADSPFAATEARAGVVPSRDFEGPFPAPAGETDGPSRRGELEDWLL